MFDSAVVRAHVSAAGAKGGKKGKRSGGRVAASPRKSTQNRTPSGDIIAFDLTGGEAFDGRHFETLLRSSVPTFQPRAVICDKGYASKGQSGRRESARHRSRHPPQGKRKEQAQPSSHAPFFYKARARIEQGVGRLKRFKRVALRCEKTERNFRSIVSFAAGLCLIKFVHTA